MFKTFDEYIKESYNNFGFVKSRSNYYLINESQESKSQSEAIKLVMDKFGWDHEKADKFVRMDLRNDITPLRDKQIGKFTLGVARMYCDKQITDANTISDINATLKLLTAHLNEYDRNLNGLSAEELISKFKQVRENNVKKEKQEINRMKFGVSDYEIVRIDSFNDAKKYYIYTNPNSRWCLTHMENMYSSYTCDGINQIYFCLRHGFEDVKPVVGENAPLDEYGLSMLSIIVNEEGELAYCTTRWNHENGGNDSAMNAVEISKVVNVNFYESFKPNTKWKDMVDNAKQRLANGETIEEIFNETKEFSEGYVGVRLKDKWNFINKNGEYLSDKWFDDIDEFREGYAAVKLNNKWNFINKNGEILSDKWFYDIGDFREGYAAVNLNNKWNFINKNGEILLDKWFDYVDDFREGYARVELNKKYNLINKNGEYMFDKWLDYIDDFIEGCAKVILNDKFNYINKNCEFMSDKWFDNVEEFENGYSKVKLNDKWNFINKNGEFLSDEWFDNVKKFKYCYGGYEGVKLNGKWNIINGNYENISDTWYDNIDYFDCGYSVVRFEVLLNFKWNFINKNGEILSDTWFDAVYNFENHLFRGYAIVELDDKYNLINKNIEILSDKWFDSYKDAKNHLSNLLKK